MTTTTLTLTAREFAQLVDPVLPFVTQDETLPILTAVRITTAGGYAIARATDRYRAAFQRVPIAHPEGEPLLDGFDALLSARAIKAIRSTFKVGRANSLDSRLSLTVDGEHVDVASVGGLGLGDLAGATLRLHQVLGKFPPIETLINWDSSEDAGQDLMVNTRFLADLKATTREDAMTPLVIHPAAQGKSIRVSRGADFVAIIQPVLGSVDLATRDSWESILAPAAQESEASAAPRKRSRKKDTAA